MKKRNKILKIISLSLLSCLGLFATGCSLFDGYKEWVDDIFDIPNEDSSLDQNFNNQEEFIKGDSFLNLASIRGLKNTEYTLTASVTPIDHTAPVIWSSDYPNFVSVEAGENDTAKIIRHEDFRGYVNITASIDGVSATCKVYCTDEIVTTSITLKEAPQYSYTQNGVLKYYWNEHCSMDKSYFIVSAEYTSERLGTSNIANEPESFDINDYFYRFNKWNIPTFIGIDHSYWTQSNQQFVDNSDGTFTFKEDIKFVFTEEEKSSDLIWNPCKLSLSLNFMEYITATGIVLDKSDMTI